MLDSLLIPLDGSEFSEQTLPYAASVARAAGARVHLAHVHVPHPPEDLLLNPQFQFEGVNMAEYEAKYRAEEEDYLKGIAAKMEQDLGDSVVPTLLEGDVSSSIERYALTNDTDMIVMSTHGRTGLSRFWLGSVADELVRHTSIPVLLIPPSADGQSGVDHQFKHILVPLDGSERGEAILEPAMELGAEWKARFTLLHVVPVNRIVGARVYPIPMGHLEERRNQARQYLAGLSDRLRDQGLEVNTRVVDHATPAEAILRTAEAENADLVALATHGHRNLARAVLGSVADKVVRATTRPLLVMRPDKD
jgi:nucleotide-binding universal stress UspA family protein